MNILLGVTGSISVYKTIDLAREYVKRGHQVRVIFTTGALKFVRAELYGYLGIEKYFLPEEDFLHSNVLHVDLAKWADTFVIAPLSANSLSRLASGEASDLLTSVFLAYPKDKPILIFPAMNTEMLSHPFTEENFQKLTKLQSLINVFISETGSGLLACGDIGLGKLPTVEEILEITECMNTRNLGEHRKVLITTGASVVPIDPVRFLTNSSSGLTGFELAKTFLEKGFYVTLLAGINSTEKLELLKKHPRLTLKRLKTVQQFNQEVQSHLHESALFVSSAALSDWDIDPIDEKIKKDRGVNELKLKPAPDVLKNVTEAKKQNKTKAKIVGFAAETNLTKEMLMEKQNKKTCDLLIGTLVNNGLLEGSHTKGFNVTTAHYRVLSGNELIFDHELSKKELGLKILEWLKL